MSDPDVQHAREALAKLEHLVVQEIFLTETAYHADVILPATAFPEKTGTFTNTDRRVQLGRQALRAARRGAAGLVDHPGDRPPARARLGLQRTRATSSPRCAQAMPSLRGHHLGAARARGGGDLPVRRARTSPATRSSSATASRPRAAGASSSRADVLAARRDARRRLPDGPDDRPPARALAHRRDDPARERARRARARGDRPPRRRATCGGSASRPATRSASRPAAASIELTARADRDVPARPGLHPVLLRRGRRQPADQPGARPVRQDPRVQVLRRPGRAAEGDGRGGGVGCGAGVRPSRLALRASTSG